MDSGSQSAAPGAEQPAVSSTPPPEAEPSSPHLEGEAAEEEAFDVPALESSTPDAPEAAEASTTAPEVAMNPSVGVDVRVDTEEQEATVQSPDESAASGAVIADSPAIPASPEQDLDFPEEVQPAQLDTEHQFFDTHDFEPEPKPPVAVANAYSALAESSSEESVPELRVFELDQEDQPVETTSQTARGSQDIPTSSSAAAGADKGKGKSKHVRPKATDQPGHRRGTRAGQKHAAIPTKKRYSDLHSVTASWFASETYRFFGIAYHLSGIHFDHAYREYPDYLNWNLMWWEPGLVQFESGS